jgi:hypothetical protein
MKILIDDFVQDSDAPDALKSPALADDYEFTTSIDIDLGSSKTINCIGIGNTDGVNFTVDGQAVTFSENGLYILSPAITDQVITIGYDGSYVGRIALGVYRQICTAPNKEIGFYSTEQNRITASGQVQPGAGGITGRKLNLDSRYKIDETIYQDFENAYPRQLGKLFPFFLNFADELKIPYDYFYGGFDKSVLSLQSAIYRFLYSRRFDFIERF